MSTNDGGPRHDSEVLSRTFLNARTYRVLTSAGYVTVGDVKAATDVELLSLRSISRVSLDHIRTMCPFEPLATVHDELKKVGPGVGPIPNDLRDWFAGQALAALLADHEREWFPDFDDVVEDPDGRWMLNPDTKVVYPIPVSYTPSKSHVRVRSINTWRERLAREAYRIADAMLAARNTHT